MLLEDGKEGVCFNRHLQEEGHSAKCLILADVYFGPPEILILPNM